MGNASRFVWYDHSSDDPTKAIAFYKAVVGWSEAPFAAAPEYRMMAVGEQPIGGYVRLAEPAKAMGVPPHWLAYVAVADIAAACDKATALGGNVVVQPTEIPGAGKFAVLVDPQGATVALYGDDVSGDPPPRTDGFFSWGELATTDVDAAWAFYSALFGWHETSTMDMGPDGAYKMYGTDSVTSLGGIFRKHDHMPVSFWLHYITVPDLNAALERVKAHGGSVLNGPLPIPGGDTIAQCMDDQGAAFALYEEGVRE